MTPEKQKELEALAAECRALRNLSTRLANAAVAISEAADADVEFRMLSNRPFSSIPPSYLLVIEDQEAAPINRQFLKSLAGFCKDQAAIFKQRYDEA